MNIIQINETFPTELHAIEFFEQQRWGEKPTCVYCKSEKLSARQKDNRFRCISCNKGVFVTVGTQLEGTKIPLKTWLIAFSIISDAKKGLSALQLQRNLNISYPTAWAMYHKIRDLMTDENDSIQKLNDVVEMDETFIGGKPRKANNIVQTSEQKKEFDNRIKEIKSMGYDLSPKKGNSAKPDIGIKRGRGSEKKTSVVGMVERDGNVIAQVMETLSRKNLMDMVKRNIDTENALLITDTYKGYNRIDQIIENIKVDHTKGYSYQGVNTNTIESFWAIVKRGIIGQYHQVSVKHLPKYIAEFVFKYNNRNDDDMFETLVKKAVNPKSL